MRKVILALLMLVTCFSAFTSVTYAKEVGATNTVAPPFSVMAVTDSNEPIDLTVKSNMITQYYINLELKDKTFYIRNTGNLNFSQINELIEKNNFLATFVFTYNDMTITEKPVITSWNMKFAVGEQVNTGGYGSLLPIVFATDAPINVRSIYYDYFSNSSLNNISISVFIDGYGYPLVNYQTKYYIPFLKLGKYYVFPNYFNLGASLETRSVPPDYNYLEEEGQLPDNGGINIISQKKASDGFDLLGYIINAFKAVFGGTADIMQYITVAVTVIVGLFLLGLIIKLFAWVLK